MSNPVFSVIAVTKYADSSYRIELKPTQDNLEWWDTDPNGKAQGRIELTVKNLDTANLFIPGKNYNAVFSQKTT